MEQLQLGTYTKFRRKKIKDGTLEGFVLDHTNDLTLLGIVDDFALNGFCLFRNADVTKYSVYDKAEYFLTRACRLLGIDCPERPDVDARSFATGIASAATRYPLVVLYKERLRPDVCWVGRYVTHTKKTVTIDEIDAAGDWGRTSQFKLKDLTMIGFGGRYETALWLVAEDNRKAKKDGG